MVLESLYTELALYGSNNEYAWTDTVFLPITKVCDGTVEGCMDGGMGGLVGPLVQNCQTFLEYSQFYLKGLFETRNVGPLDER